MYRKWHDKLELLNKRYPCSQVSLHFKNKSFLPFWFYGPSFSWFNHIVISNQFESVDDDVRGYLLGHEYGHIYYRDSLRFLSWYIASVLVTILIAVFCTARISSIWMYLYCLTVIVSCYFLKYAEFKADDMAAKFVGKPAVINGLLYMGEKTGTLNCNRRIERLKRMGWEKHN